MKLNVTAFGLTFGLIWGLGLFFITWWIIAFEGSSGQETFIGLVYRGYTISAIGSVVGLVWGLADGFIGGIIFAWLYNLIVSKLGE